jgi:hypothetical protein
MRIGERGLKAALADALNVQDVSIAVSTYADERVIV